MRALLLLASALLVSRGPLCAAAPKVAIRIVPRSSPEEPAAPTGPVPFRVPNVYWQGPFVSAVDSSVDPLPCVKETAVTIDSAAALLDVCHLKNVTLVKQPVVVEGGDSEGETAQPDMRKILGIFRGWKIDPITMRYKQMLFDDGDECGESGNRMSMVLDIAPAKSASAKPRVYAFKQLDSCSFRATLFAHVPPADMKPSDSIHTPGVLGITDANETLPQICAQRTCRFNTIMNKVRSVMMQVRHAEDVATEIVTAKTPALANFTLSSSKAILRSSNAVLDYSLELLSTLETLQLSLQKKLEEMEKRAAEAAEADSEAQGSDKSESVASDDVASESAADESAGSDAVQDESSDEGDADQTAADSVREVVVEAQG